MTCSSEIVLPSKFYNLLNLFVLPLYCIETKATLLVVSLMMLFRISHACLLSVLHAIKISTTQTILQACLNSCVSHSVKGDTTLCRNVSKEKKQNKSRAFCFRSDRRRADLFRSYFMTIKFFLIDSNRFRINMCGDSLTMRAHVK